MLLGCVFLFAIALATLKPLPVRLIFERDGIALGVSTAITAYRLHKKALKLSTWKMHTTFYAELQTAENTKYINKIATLAGWRGWRGLLRPTP